METEIWKDIEGYSGTYQISSEGRIISKKTEFPKLRKLQRNTKGYEQIDLWKKSKQWTAKVHFLVAHHFIPNPESKPCVNHKNGIKHDNRVENLEWCTHKENTVHAVATGLMKKGRDHHMYGKKGPNAGKFGIESNNHREVIQIGAGGAVIRRWGSIQDACNALGIHKGNVTKACRGDRKMTGGYAWKYV